jgi:hypothetical protein
VEQVRRGPNIRIARAMMKVVECFEAKQLVWRCTRISSKYYIKRLDCFDRLVKSCCVQTVGSWRVGRAEGSVVGAGFKHLFKCSFSQTRRFFKRVTQHVSNG